MAENFFKEIENMGPVGDIVGMLVSGLANSGLMPKNTTDGKLLAAQAELFNFKKQETDLLLEVGKKAYEQNPSLYEQDDKIKLVRQNIAAAQTVIDELETKDGG